MAKNQIVAIIDDDPSVRAGLKSLVRSLGFTALDFKTAEEFLSSLRINETACAIADVHMPGMSGLDLQTVLMTQGRSIPIIFMTAYFTQKACERALASGALAYLEKPFDGEVMASLLRKALSVPPS